MSDSPHHPEAVAVDLERKDITIIDGSAYVVVIDRILGIIYRVRKPRKPRVGLMRFER